MVESLYRLLMLANHAPVPILSIANISFNVVCGNKIIVKFLNLQNPGLEVIKLEYSLKLKIKRNDWLLADTCPQAANHCAVF